MLAFYQLSSPILGAAYEVFGFLWSRRFGSERRATIGEPDTASRMKAFLRVV